MGDIASFTVLGLSGVDVVGFATGVTSLWLIARQSVWNFPVGIVSMSCYAYAMWTYHLFANVGIGLLFIVLLGYGWAHWGGTQRSTGEDLEVAHVTRAAATGLAVAGVLGALALGTALALTGDSAVPALDATTAAVSLVAQVMVARKYVENWYLWAVADVAYIAMFSQQGAWVWAALYAVYLAMAVHGIRSWRESMVAGAGAGSEPGAGPAAGAAASSTGGAA